MLLQFKVKNFKCFYEEAVLDLMATQEKNHINSTILVNNNRILPVIEINGANASGKSSILEALKFMFNIIKNSTRVDVNKDLPYMPYAFSEKAKEENSEFEFTIVLDDYEYRYGFSMNKNAVLEEWLYKKKFSNSARAVQKIVFEREKGKVFFGSNYEKYEKTWKFFGNNLSINTDKLLVLSNIAIKEDKGILRDIYEYIDKFCFRIDYMFKKKISIEILNRDTSLFDKFLKIINEFDPCLLDIEIEEIISDDNTSYNISGVHKSNSDNQNILIPLERESAGTIKMINILPTILVGLEIGGLVCIDELDTRLHPLLFRKIVNMFKNKNVNKNNAQLIYTAHSTFLFNSGELRRDQLYLIDKDKFGQSKIYSLSEFRNLRTDTDYEKKYLTGQFGAIPFDKI